MALTTYKVEPGKKGLIYQAGPNLIIVIGDEEEIEKLKNEIGRVQPVTKFECEESHDTIM